MFQTNRIPLNIRIECVRLFSIHNNYSEVHRQLQLKGIIPPSIKQIRKYNIQFDKSGTVLDEKVKTREKRVTTEENKERIRDSIFEDESQPYSQRKLEKNLDISRRSIGRMLKEMKLKPYRPRLINKLNEDDPDRRIEFCEKILNEVHSDGNFLKKILWTDEANFYLDGCVNRHNCVYYRESNPLIFFEKSQFSPKILVWMGVCYDGIVGPFIFKECVNAGNYLNLLQSSVVPVLREKFDMGQIVFQHDGAPSHFARCVRDYLDLTFPGRWIGRRGVIDWPARSPDLTVMDFSIWGYLKDRVYSHQPTTLDELELALFLEAQQIPKEMIEKACLSVYERVEMCIAAEGDNVDNIMEN